MKIKNKFDMLNAMSDINEEYVRKADRLLAQHRTGEAAVKMEITPMKFSWKPIAAVAACLVLLVGMTFGIKALMNKPVDALTPAQQAYLDEWKRKIGANVNVAYAVDRLTFIEIELPEDVNTNRFIDENRAVFLKDKKINDEPHKTLEIYNIKEKTCSVIAELDPERTWDIYNADKDYVLYQSYKGDYGTDEELYLYDVNTAQNHLIYKEETNDTDLSYSSSYINNDKIAFCGRVYFPTYDRITGMPSLHIYGIESGTEFGVFRNIGDLSNYSSNIFYACGENGQYYSGTVSGTESDVSKGVGSPSIYKGDILYGTEENGKFVTRSLSGKYSFDGGVWATEYGLYQFEAVGGRLTKLDTGMEIIPANSSEGIINLDNRCDFALQFGGMSLNSIEASQSALRFLFYAPTDEILVFQDGDGFGELNCFGWGATISKKEPDGTFRTFIVTDKESEYAVKIPKLDIKSDPYLEKMKSYFGAHGSVDYARNKLDIAEYDISGFESIPVLVDKTRAAVTVKDNNGYPELRLHDLDSGKETTLYSRKDDPGITSDTDIAVLYANKDYVVFDIKFYAGATLDKRELRIVEINGKKSYTAYTMFGDSVHRIMVIVDDTLYFYTNNIIYRYKIGSKEQAVQAAHGYNVRAYNGQVYYNENFYPNASPIDDSFYVLTHVVDGEMPIDTAEKYGLGFSIGKYGIFYSDYDKTITDCVNDRALLSGGKAGHLSAYLYDSMLIVVDDIDKKDKNNKVIYNVKTDELLVFDEDEDLYYEFRDYREFDGGMYYALESDGAYSKLCVITEKDAKRDENAEKTYLEKMKDFFGAHGGVDYARNKLDIKEYDISGFESIPVLVDKTRAAVTVKDNNGYPELRLHDLNSGGYTVLHSRAEDPEINAETEIWQPYVNKDYAVFEIVFYEDMAIKKYEVRAVELATRKWYTVCSPWSWFGVSAIDGNVMYFSISSDVSYTPSVYYRYEIGSEMEPEEICRGENLTLYNGELYYNTRDYGVDDLGQSTVNYTVYRVGSDQPAVDVEKYGSDFKLGKYGIFGSESGGIVTDCVSGKTVLSGGQIDKLELKLRDFALLVGDDSNKAVYDLNTDELLVFDEDDDFYKGEHFREFDGGIYLIKWENGAHSKLYVITEKGSQNETKPEPEKPDERSRHLAELKKKFDVEIPMGYVEDNFNIQSYDLPETINGKTAEYFGESAEKTVIDKTRLIVGLTDGTDSWAREFGIYDFVSGSYESLYRPAADVSLTFPEFVNSDYFVFNVTEGSESTAALYVIALKSSEHTPILAYRETEGAYLIGGSNCVILDKKLYFDVNRENFWASTCSLYCYDIETRRLECAVETGCKAAVYKNGIAYSRGDIQLSNRVAFLDGSSEIASPSADDEIYICENNIFKIEYKIASLTDVTTGQRILGSKNMFFVEAGSRNYLEFYDYAGPDNPDTYMVYDIINNKLFVYENSLNCDVWLSDGTGAAFSYAVSNDTYKENKISLFTAK